MKTEKDLYRYLKKAAAAAHVLCEKLHAESINGWPDVELVHNGHTVRVELKTPAKTGRLSPIQKVTIARLTDQGAEVYVINSKKEADLIITGLVDRRPAPSYRPLIRP